MEKAGNIDKFTKYAWFTLAFNIAVIVWGVFLRASLSGDGCGQHWLTCNGEVVPESPQFKTVIEFTHRVSTGIVFFVVLGLAVWAFRKFPRGSSVVKTAFASFLFIVAEAAIGAGLVLTGNTATNMTATRPIWMMAHLITTFSLLATLSLTAWFAGGGRSFTSRAPRRVIIMLAIAIILIFLVGASGSLAALSSMLFPSGTLAEGIAKDFAAGSHFLLRLRLSHPIVAIGAGVYLIFLAGWFRKRAADDAVVKRWSDRLSILVVIQLISGAGTLLMLSPIVLQLIHLLLADLVWIAFVLMTAAFLAGGLTAETQRRGEIASEP
jgi:heme A synthase